MTVYLVELEPVETRYTAQWKTHLPEQMRKAGIDVVVIEGPSDAPKDTTPGAFLNFSGTNYWKSEQLKTISTLFADGKVKDGDYFLYTDAWNPTVIQLKYMSALLQVNIRIGGLWHAGSYDPQDFLGRLIGDAEWVRYAERSMFGVFDDNFYATEFHIDLFCNTFFDHWTRTLVKRSRVKRVGWPMEYMKPLLAPFDNKQKENIVLFPHRIAPEKQVEIFKDLATEFEGEAEFIVCQEQQLTKDQYHELLGKSKIVFSANLQETLGISCYEGALVGAVPMVPDRLSYTEMYPSEYKYPSRWTESWDSYLENKHLLVRHIRNTLDSYKTHDFEGLVNTLDSYFSGEQIYNAIKGKKK